MTNSHILYWIKKELSADIQAAIAQFPETMYTEPDLAGMTLRETGVLLAKYIDKVPPVPVASIAAVMRGDYGQREGELEKSYHGYGLTQIDVGSFPEFVKSGDWKIPLKCYIKSLSVLAGKLAFIEKKVPLSPEGLKRAALSAYNCGEGNVYKSITRGWDPDHYTAGGNYAKAIFEYSEIYSTLE